MNDSNRKIIIAMPVFNHREKLNSLLEKIKKLNLKAILVDDGSHPPISEQIIANKDVKLIRHTRNLGKGAAIRTAANYAISQGAETLITIDADGQHSPEDIPAILNKVLETNNNAIIIGARKFKNENVPFASRIGRVISNLMVYLETGIKISDTQSGFRAYPLKIFDQQFLWSSSGYEFETEVLVKSLIAGIPCKEVEISVKYPLNRISHFKLLREIRRFTILHIKLIIYSSAEYFYPTK